MSLFTKLFGTASQRELKSIYPIADKVDQLEEEYKKRLGAFTKIEIVEVRDEPNERIEREKEAALAKEKEGERALSQIKDSEFVILLDLHGSHWDSETFAEKLGKWQTASSTSPL